MEKLFQWLYREGKMKTIILLILLSTTTMFSQFKDVSRPVKECLQKVGGIDFYGASLETNGTLHITVGYNSLWDMYNQENGNSLENILFATDFRVIFNPARDIFKKMPNAKIKISSISPSNKIKRLKPSSTAAAINPDSS